MKSKGPAQFRKCHLTILRSLYGGESNCSKEMAAVNTVDASSSSSIDAMSSHNEEIHQTGEPPVSDTTWDHIHQFIQQRNEYHPLKQRKNYWVQLNQESTSRLDDLLEKIHEENRWLSSQKRKSTPSRTPLLTMIKKRTTTPTLSLTPMSTNRTETHRETPHDHEISSWTFIDRMVRKRTELCTSSCESFRAQPFLEKLQIECDLRCKVLNAILQRWTCQEVEQHRDAISSLMEERDNSKKRDAVTVQPEALAKRQKRDGSTNAGHAIPSEKTTLAQVPSSSTELYFFRDYSSIDAHTHNAEASHLKTINSSSIDDLRIEIQIKYYLWSSLFSSVKEIVDEK